jgi:uncharacterized protein YebE (UPF0316 family)
VVKISPEWVTGPEQGKSSGRVATFSLWTGGFRDGIVIDNKIIEQVNLFNYLGNMISYEKELDIDNKLHNYFENYRYFK